MMSLIINEIFQKLVHYLNSLTKQFFVWYITELENSELRQLYNVRTVDQYLLIAMNERVISLYIQSIHFLSAVIHCLSVCTITTR